MAKRARELESLSIEQRQPAGALVGLVGEATALDERGAALVHRGLALAAAEGRRHHHVLEHGHAGKGLRNLEGAREPAPAAPLGREPRDVGAVEADAAGVGRHRAGGDAEQRGLAGAVRPDDAERLAVFEREIDAVGHHHGAETLRYVLQREDGRHGCSQPLPCSTAEPIPSSLW